MRTIRILSPAALLLCAAGLSAQTTQPGPTTGGTAPTPTSPTTGGRAPSRPMVIFPTDAPRTPTTGTPVIASGVFPVQPIQFEGVPPALNLTDRQLAQLNTLTQQVQSQFQPQFDRLPALRTADQAAQLEQLNREYTAAWLNASRQVFNESQLTRYQQLQRQFGGFDSLNDPFAQRALSLSDAQVARLRENVAWSDLQEAAIRQAALTDQARAVELFNAFNTAAQTRLNQMLTPAQQQAWAQLTGDPFAFPPVFPAVPGNMGTVPPTAPGTAPAAPGTTPPAGPTRPAPITPGTPGPTTGGAAPPPTGPTTGGPARPGGPTTGGTVPPGGPTTGGKAPGGPGSPVPPKM